MSSTDEVAEDPEQMSTKRAPHSAYAVVMARAGYQSLAEANNAVAAIFRRYPEIGAGTAGSAMRVPTGELPTVLRELADILDREYVHQYSKERVLGSLGIDNWSISIQAEKPDP